MKIEQLEIELDSENDEADQGEEYLKYYNHASFERERELKQLSSDSNSVSLADLNDS